MNTWTDAIIKIQTKEGTTEDMHSMKRVKQGYPPITPGLTETLTR
jgi:hypothetical protein